MYKGLSPPIVQQYQKGIYNTYFEHLDKDILQRSLLSIHRKSLFYGLLVVASFTSSLFSIFQGGHLGILFEGFIKMLLSGKTNT